MLKKQAGALQSGQTEIASLRMQKQNSQPLTNHKFQLAQRLRQTYVI